MNATIEITRQALDAGKIVHTGWAPNRDTADRCGVNVIDYFDVSGKFLGPDQNGVSPTFEPATPAPFSVQWEFTGPATQERFEAAQAVADAMEILGTIETTKDVLAKAGQILGRDWDSKSVSAMIENCSFERIDQDASADNMSNYKVVTDAQNTGLDSEVFATKAEAEDAIELCKQFVFSDYTFDVLPTNDEVTTTLQEWSEKDWE